MVTNDFLSVLAACPWIRELELGQSHREITDFSALCLSMLSKTWNLVSAIICLSFRSNDGTGRCCEIFANGRANLEFLCTFPGISCGEGAVFAAHVLRHVGDIFGRTFEKCDIFLGEDVSPADLQSFLSRCSNIFDLTLTPHRNPEHL